MTITCTRFRPYNKNTLQGFATLLVDDTGMEINSISVHRKGSEKWLGFPSHETNEKGEKKYYSYIYFPDREQQRKFVHQAMLAIEKKINEPEQSEIF